MKNNFNGTGAYIEEINGKEVLRFKTDKKYNNKELEKQRNAFYEAAKSGKTTCLTDLFSNHGL